MTAAPTKDEMLDQMTLQFRGFIEKMYRIGEASLAQDLLDRLEDKDRSKSFEVKILTFLREKQNQLLEQ